MNAKEQLKQKFSSDPDRYYRVKLFDEMDFMRKKCINCGAFFWTLDDGRNNCPNPPCDSYGFIGKPLNKKLDYIKTWETIKEFFVKNGHTAVDSYPAVCRWFPGLYFTVASIVAFQRSLNGKTVFEMPANPLIIPQSCMRFNDVPNVGVTGRHFTNFTMIGQHSIFEEDKRGYWKDRCVELDFKLLTKAFKIKPEEINFVEDVWVGPNAFGYSLEYYFRGLELGNAVFTEFVGTPENYKQMDQKVIDMGAGLERFAWVAQGTPTAYDAVFGPVAKKLLSLTDYDESFWVKYSRVAGKFNMEDFRNYSAAKQKAAEEMEMHAGELVRKTAPVEALYAITDHARSLLLAVADGGLPSNVGGGYNLRVVLRRALGFIDEFNFDLDLIDVCEMHAKYLKNFRPRLDDSIDGLRDILVTEKERYKTSRKQGESILNGMIKKKEAFTTEKLIQLYESNGITPETIEKLAKKESVPVEIPTDFYDILSSKHMKEKAEEETKLNLEGLKPTRLLFYENQYSTEFSAKVLRIIENRYVVLDKTCFYGRAGGQQGDRGNLNGCHVTDTEKYGSVIVHIVEHPNFSEGDTVHGKIDWAHREQLMRHHTAVHVIHGSAHRILGNHVWQAGANKTAEKAHLDITHYKPLTEEDIAEIEKLANSVVKKSIKINKYVLSREEAEKRYGFTIYQGGAIPQNQLRIIEIPDSSGKIFDVEACSGTHCDNTSQMDPIVITAAERIQDGIVRISIVSGEAAKKYLDIRRELLGRVEKILGAEGEDTIKEAESLFARWKKLKKEMEKDVEAQAQRITEKLETKFVKNILVAEVEGADSKKLQSVSKALSNDDRIIILFGVTDKINVFAHAGKNTNIDAGNLVRDVCRKLGGNGGGSRKLAQGVGFKTDILNKTIRDMESELYG